MTRAHLAELEAHEGLNQRAGVARHDLFDLVVGELGTGAQADAPGARTADDLLGHVEAERADDLAALLAEVVELFDAQSVHLGHDEVEVAHALGAVLLRHVRVAVHLADGFQQRVVRREVQTKFGPHLAIVGCCGLSHA